jgi:hypothetical protein
LLLLGFVALLVWLASVLWHTFFLR